MKSSSKGVLVCVAAGLLASGCAPSQESSKPAPAAASPQAASTSELPKLGDAMPMLDDGRIDAAPPNGWHVPSRSNKWVARFQKDTGASYPTIIITAEDYAGCPDTTAENVNELAARVASEESAPETKPVTAGDFVGVAYRKRGIEKDSVSKVLERLMLVTVVADRKYTLELRTREGSLAEAQPYLLAVARGITFHQAKANSTTLPAAKSEESEPAEAEPSPEKPSTEKPSKKKPLKKIDLDDLDLDGVDLQGLDDMLKKK